MLQFCSQLACNFVRLFIMIFPLVNTQTHTFPFQSKSNWARFVQNACNNCCLPLRLDYFTEIFIWRKSAFCVDACHHNASNVAHKSSIFMQLAFIVHQIKLFNIDPWGTISTNTHCLIYNMTQTVCCSNARTAIKSAIEWWCLNYCCYRYRIRQH